MAHGVQERFRSPFALPLLLLALLVGCRKPIAPIPPGPFETTEVIYDAGLKSGWQDYGWGKHDLSQGAARIDMSQYGGWILHHEPLANRYGALVFRMLAPASFGTFLRVQLGAHEGDKSMPAIDIGPERTRKAAGAWVEVYVPWLDLNPNGVPVERIVLHATKPVAAEPVQFDKLGLTTLDAKTKQALADATPTREVSLFVNCREPAQPISPYIYGVAAGLWELGATARRWGGNPMTRYNWQIHAANTGKDWFFENNDVGDYRQFLTENHDHQWASALTVPMIGWVAKDRSSFGFPTAVLGAQQSEDQYRKGAGNGVQTDGKTLVTPGAPTLTSVPAPPELMQKWIEAIRTEDAKSGKRSVQLYFLDNEPSLWNTNHRDVHPAPVTYDELLERTLSYSKAIRTADPEGLIAGPAEWGWTGYLYSAKDLAASVTARPDRRAHGDTPLIPWYLKKLREHDTANGTKSIDVLDVHFYPQQQGVYGGNADPETAALRLRSTRSLWDPTYKDESWINDTIRLIPRLKQWVTENYPGLPISIGEYNFGGEQHMSGALALAEALGRFGQGGVGYAFYWFAPPKDSPTYWAFRAYRDFDGKGGRFLDLSAPTRMDSEVSLFASRDKAGKHYVLVALNKNPTKAARAKVSLDGCTPIRTRRRFNYDANSPTPVDQGVSDKPSIEERLEPYSISVFDIELK